MITRKLFNETVFTISDDDYEYEPIDLLMRGNKLFLGGYSWSLIGRLHGKDLYLCDDVIKKMSFNDKVNNGEWNDSNIRKYLNYDFYQSLSNLEKQVIVKNKETGDNIFLLSKNEFDNNYFNISKSKNWWWLRSLCDNAFNSVAYVYVVRGNKCGDGLVCDDELGVRPAILV